MTEALDEEAPPELTVKGIQKALTHTLDPHADNSGLIPIGSVSGPELGRNVEYRLGTNNKCAGEWRAAIVADVDPYGPDVVSLWVFPIPWKDGMDTPFFVAHVREGTDLRSWRRARTPRWERIQED